MAERLRVTSEGCQWEWRTSLLNRFARMQLFTSLVVVFQCVRLAVAARTQSSSSLPQLLLHVLLLITFACLSQPRGRPFFKFLFNFPVRIGEELMLIYGDQGTPNHPIQDFFGGSASVSFVPPLPRHPWVTLPLVQFLMHFCLMLFWAQHRVQTALLCTFAGLVFASYLAYTSLLFLHQSAWSSHPRLALNHTQHSQAGWLI